MQPCKLEHVESTCSVYAEIGERFFGSPVVAWLCSGMYDQRDIVAIFFEHRFEIRIIADVDVIIFVVGKSVGKAVTVPVCRSFLTKKVLSQVIVNANDQIEFICKKRHCFTTDQTS